MQAKYEIEQEQATVFNGGGKNVSCMYLYNKNNSLFRIMRVMLNLVSLLKFKL